MPRLIAFDLETTGLDDLQDRIIEFCFIEVDEALQPVSSPWSELVDPQRDIPQEVQEITNITPDMVEGRPPFAQHAARIQRLVADATLIAHNHRFDLTFLHRELERAGQPGLDPNHPCVDTLGIERAVNAHNLAATYQRYTGNEMDGAHRSQADTEATLEILRHQIKGHGLPPAGELTQAAVRRLRDPDDDPRRWLDHAHRFYEDTDGTVRFGFGKHRDGPVADEPGFLRWMLNRDFAPDTLAVARRLLGAAEGRATP
ncbi:MAG: exonuclease domain-containing protein [Thermoplasmatota archaeon]